MAFNLWERTEAKRLPQSVREYIRKRFMLTVDYIDRLKCFEFEDEFHGEPVKRLHIFSPEDVKKAGLVIRKISELEQHPEVILFEGYMDYLDRVYIADRRMPPKAVVKKKHITLLHILATLHFCNLGRCRNVGSAALESYGASTTGGTCSNANPGEVKNDPGEVPLCEKSEERTTARTAPVKKVGSYGPGAGWPHSYETRELREWLNPHERKSDDR